MIYRNGVPVIGFAGTGCANNPMPRAGYSVWKGAVPPELTKWAVSLRDTMGPYPYGQEWSTMWGTLPVIGRKDHHTWTYRKNPDGSTTLRDDICIPGITLYRPINVTLYRPTGVSRDDVLDPATARPDPELALFGALGDSRAERTRAAFDTLLDEVKRFARSLSPKELDILKLGLEASHMEESVVLGDWKRAEAHADKIIRILHPPAAGVGAYVPPSAWYLWWVARKDGTGSWFGPKLLNDEEVWRLEFDVQRGTPNVSWLYRWVWDGSSPTWQYDTRSATAMYVRAGEQRFAQAS